MLTCSDISVTYPTSGSGALPVIQGISLTIAPGAITTILGPNGCGKTTLLRAFLGLLPLSKGIVAHNATPIEAFSASERAARMAYAPQNPTAAPGFSAFEVLNFASAGQRTLNAKLEDSSFSRHHNRVIDALDLAPLAKQPFDHLSAGQRQRVSLGRAVLQLLSSPLQAEHKVLLADEPGSAMDPHHLLRAESLLVELASQGHAVVMVLHDLLAARRCADTAVMMRSGGTLAHTGSTEAILTPPLLTEVFGTQFAQTPHGPVLRPHRAEV